MPPPDIAWYRQNELDMEYGLDPEQARYGLACDDATWAEIMDLADDPFRDKPAMLAASLHEAHDVPATAPDSWVLALAKACLLDRDFYGKPFTARMLASTTHTPSSIHMPTEASNTSPTQPLARSKPAPTPSTWKICVRACRPSADAIDVGTVMETFTIRVSLLRRDWTGEPCAPFGRVEEYSFQTLRDRIRRRMKRVPLGPLVYHDLDNDLWLDVEHQVDFQDALVQLMSSEETNAEWHRQVIPIYFVAQEGKDEADQTSRTPSLGSKRQSSAVGGKHARESPPDQGLDDALDPRPSSKKPNVEFGTMEKDESTRSGDAGMNVADTTTQDTSPLGLMSGAQIIQEAADRADASEAESDGETNLDENVETIRAECLAALASAADSKVVERVDEGAWQECCEFLDHDSSKRGPEDKVWVYGIREERLPHPHQALLAIWALRTASAGLGGGIVADEAGTGKTQCMLTLFVLMRHIALMYDDVHRYRAAVQRSPARASNPLHLPPSTLGQRQTATVCPSSRMRQGWAYRLRHPCPCQEGSFLHRHRIKAKLGLFLTLVPQGLITRWQREFRAIMDPETGTGVADVSLKLQLCIPYHQGVGGNDDGRYSNFTRFQMNQMQAKATSDNVSTLGVSPRLVLNICGQVTNTAYLVVTTSYSVHKHLLDPNIVSKPEPHVALAFSCIVRDEFHLEKSDTSKTIMELNRKLYNRSVFRVGRPWIFPMSATPFTDSVLDISAYVELMRCGRPWEESTNTAHRALKLGKMHAIHGRFVRDVNRRIEAFNTTNDLATNPTEADLTRLELKKRQLDDSIQESINALTEICDLVMIRRTSTTDFFGHPICTVPPNFHEDTAVELLPEYATEIDAYQSRIKEELESTHQRTLASQSWGATAPTKPKIGSKHFNLRQMVTCPHLYRIWVHENSKAAEELESRRQELRDEGKDPSRASVRDCRAFLDLTQAQAHERSWLSNPLSSIYAQHIREIVASSPKVQLVGEYVRKRKDVLDVFDQPVKEVFASCYATIAIILYVYFVKVLHVRPDDIAFIYPGLRRADRQARIDAFEQTPNYEKDDCPLPELNPRYVIAVLSAVAEGIDLVRGVHVTLMEPQEKSVTEQQLYGRVSRIKQENPSTTTRRLFTSNSAAEMRIVILGEHRKRREQAMQQSRKAQEEANLAVQEDSRPGSSMMNPVEL